MVGFSSERDVVNLTSWMYSLQMISLIPIQRNRVILFFSMFLPSALSDEAWVYS